MKKKIISFLVFSCLGLILLQIPFTDIIGSNQKYSFFDFIAPAIGAFLTSIWGAISVITIKIINALATGQTFDTTTIIRLFPLALAALYFGTKKFKILVAILPLICLVLFVLHPEGRQAWYYSLYWLIPIASVFAKRSLVLNSLGATFTAHALGSVAFLYAFNLPAEVWTALIPVVFLERMMFTGGTVVSYVFLNSLINLTARIPGFSFLERFVSPDHTLSKKLLVNL